MTRTEALITAIQAVAVPVSVDWPQVVNALNEYSRVGLTLTSIQQQGRQVRITGSAPTNDAEILLITAFPVPPAGYIVYIVARNDTLFSLAQRFGTTVDAIMRINNLPNTQINTGQQLLIPHSWRVCARAASRHFVGP